MAKQLSVEVWSDIACPWCYVGKRRLEAALREFPHASDVRVAWHAFELDPGAPRTHDASQTHAQRLARKYGVSVARAEAMNARLSEAAAADGLRFDFAQIRSGVNTFDAHRVVCLAAQRGLQDALEERFMRAYFSEGALVTDHDTLCRLAGDVGIGADDVQSVLATDLYAREVREQEAQAHALGVDGVPFFVIGRRYAVAGAQPAEVLLRALETAWAEAPETLERLDGDPNAEACGPDGCAVT